MNAIVINAYGGPEALTHKDMPIPTPGPDEALVRMTAIGVNFIDIYQRMGLYPGTLPFIAGNEGAGRVEAIAPGTSGASVGDRVAFWNVRGAYAGYVVAPVDKLVKVPNDIDDQTAAAVLLQGMTAHYLTRSTYALRKGDAALVHAAAGGVGLLLTQMAHRIGARVFGTVSTDEKAALAREAGADEVILYTRQDFETEVKRLTSNAGVHVVYDSVGKTTFEKGLDCLRPRGMMVSYGQSSGKAPAIEPLRLVKGSLFLTRPTLVDYVATPEELRTRADDVFGMIERGELHVRIGHVYKLADAAQAHRDLEARKTTGKLILVP
ncbi:MAG TPA: quinone oxidoreductase [Candidatus Eremiobacteraceae bacterium]|nr:quinone oxidoreductase [Candidatus Eremiobacteraceae bacterium]